MTNADKRWQELKARNLALPIAGETAWQQRPMLPQKPQKPQKPCDIGLFSDDAAQLDLVEMARR